MLYIYRGDFVKNTVILKGNRYGISIVFDKHTEFSKLLEDLAKRLENAGDFFDSDKQLVVAFEGRELSNEELDEVLDVIAKHSKLNIQYVLDENSDLEATFFDIIHADDYEKELSAKCEANNKNESLINGQESIEKQSFPDSNLFDKTKDQMGMFYKGTLRSGQSLESPGSLVIIGDVNPGATVVAGGNIVIVGSLNGSVKAGSNGNRNAFVMSLFMNPIQIQIADVIARNPDRKKARKLKKDAMIAKIEDGHIMMDYVSKASVQNIR